MSHSLAIGDAPAHLSTVTAAPTQVRNVEGQASFEIYRAERVSVTSILFSGGDWRWRLCSGSGRVLVNSEGYRTEQACRNAINALQMNAASAMLSASTQY